MCVIEVPRVRISCSNRQSVLRLQRSDWDPCGFTSGWDLSGVGWGQFLSSFSGKLSTTDGSARISN